MPTDKNTRSSKRFLSGWKAWAAAFLGLLLIVLIGVYLYAGQFVKSTIEEQLADLDLGRSEVGSASITTSGVQASDIAIYRDGEEEPWLTVDSLNIDHPILELASGADQFNAIRADGVKAILNVDDLLEQDSESDFSWDVVKLPADKIEVTNTEVILKQSDREDLAVTGINATIESGDQISIDGEIESLLGNKVTLSGVVDPAAESLSMEIASNEFSIDTDRLQQLPLVPQDLSKNVTLDGSVGANVKIDFKEVDQLTVEGLVEVQQIDLALPQYNLPLAIQSGQVRFDTSKVTLEDIVARTEDGGQINANSETLISNWPIDTKFSMKVEDIDIATARKFVPEIPEDLKAKASGDLSGSIALAESLETNSNLSATLSVPNGRYGEIESSESTAIAEVKNLKFDDAFAFQSVDGSIRATTNFQDQRLSDVFEVLDLKELQQEYGIKAAGTGNVELFVPLATVNKLETWQMQANVKAPQAQVADQQIKDVSLVAKLEEGDLVVDPILATVVPDPDAAAQNNPPNNNAIQLSVEWPVVIVDGTKQNGNVNISITKTSTAWFYGVAEELIKKSNPEAVDSLAKFGDELAGFVNIDASISIPASEPEKINQWVASANIRESQLKFIDQALNNISATIQLEKSNLVVKDLNATNGAGDPLNGDFSINLDAPERFAGNLTADSLSVRWLEAVYETYASTEFAAPTATAGESTVADYREIMKSIKGDLRIDLSIESSVPKAPDSANGLNVQLSAKSGNLAFGDVQANQFGLQITTDADQLKIEDLKLSLSQNSLLTGKGQLDLDGQKWAGDFAWAGLPLQDLERLAAQFGSTTNNDEKDAQPVSVLGEGYTSGKLKLQSGDQENGGIAITDGKLKFGGIEIGNFKLEPFGFDVSTIDGAVKLTNFTSDDDRLAIEGDIGVALTEPYQFDVDGRLAGLSLARFFKPKSVLDEEGETTELTGIVSGPFTFSGTLSPLDWKTNGKVEVRTASVNSQPIDDIKINWEHSGNDWENSRIVAKIFGGKIRVAEVASNPERVRVEINQIEVREISDMLALPVELTGKLSGEATINEWSLEETRRADITLKGSSLLVGADKFGDFSAKAEYRNDDLEYELGGTLLSGKLSAKGKVTIDPDRLSEIVFPVELNLTNATLSALYASSNDLRALRPLKGALSAQAEMLIPLDAAPTGKGRLLANNVKWNGAILTQQASLQFLLDGKQLVFNDVKAGLKRGQITADVALPLSGESAGRFSVEFRQLDLERLTKVFGAEAVEAYGQIDAKLEGRIGKDIAGQGYVGIDQASLHGVSGQSARVPIAFEFSPTRQSGRVFLKRSKFRLFEGTVAGKATVGFGRRLALDTDLKFSKVNTGDLIETLANYGGLDQGALDGRLILSGSDIRSARDLKGSFKGTLSRASAFELPILNQLDTAITARRLDTGTYDSDEIKLTLNRGKISLGQLNFFSSVAKVAIDGDVFVDGRLDVNVAAQVETLNQPTLVDELLGSPLAQLSATPVTFFARAADFLSDRVVFLHVGGTVSRPQIRVDSGQQVREELIRYFLRDSTLLPAAANR